MTMLSRRALLATTALVPAAALVACAGTTVPQALQQAAQDVLLIDNAFVAILPDLGPLLSASTLAIVQQAVTGIQSVAAAITGATTIASAQPLVIQLESDINAIVGAVAGLNLPGTIGQVITAASILLPVIEVALNMILPAPTPAMARLRAQAAGMTPATARVILRAAAAR